MSEHEILRLIHKYLAVDLKYCEDEELLKFNNIHDMGNYLCTNIKLNVDGAADEYIKSVVKFLMNEDADIQTKDDLYKTIYQCVGYHELPKKVYIKLLREFINLNKYYKKVCSTIEKKIEDINRELDDISKKQKNLINECNRKVSFLKDLEVYENELLDLFSKCNNLKTEKEMLKFSREYLFESMGELEDIERKDLVLPYLKKLSLKLSKKDYDTEIEFQYYYEVISITEFNVENYYNIFFKVKLYKIIDDMYKEMDSQSLKHNENEIVKDLKKKIEELPRIEDLISAKFNDSVQYKSELKNLVNEYAVIEYLKERINNSFCLHVRKEILIKALDMFINEEYEVFNNIIPIQLEGMFGDYLKDTTTLNRFTDLNLYQNTVLREKIRYLKGFNSGIYAEAILYFAFHFNNRVRNLIAHGEYNHLYNNYEKHQVFSLELLLDLNFMVHMLSRRSETERMHRFINNYKRVFKNISSEKNPHYRALFNDLNGARLHYTYDDLGYPRPMQVIYWLLNPYYEGIYEKTVDKQQLIELREDVLSEEFWEYVDKLLDEEQSSNFKSIKIHPEFKSIIKGLFLCDVCHNTKEVLKRVNNKLKNM